MTLNDPKICDVVSFPTHNFFHLKFLVLNNCGFFCQIEEGAAIFLVAPADFFPLALKFFWLRAADWTGLCTVVEKADGGNNN